MSTPQEHLVLPYDDEAVRTSATTRRRAGELGRELPAGAQAGAVS